MSSVPRCWCGNQDLGSFSSDYLHCSACETLVLAKMPDPESLMVQDDEHNYYGKHYFDEIAASHGLPPLRARARADLPERCIYWLRILMRYCLPPARVLELGSAHGGFVAMMRWAGFDAIGLDLSPAIVLDARRRFDIPVLEGPVESQDISLASLDAIVLMDVLEHLARPKETLMHCLRLLKPGGLIVLQTPQYREGKSLAQMESDGDTFRQMLTPDQHLYLFSRSSVRQLFYELGVEHVKFEPAIFSFYDMSLVASSLPFAELAESDATACLERSSSGRLILALKDLDRDYRDLTSRYNESEADRAARLENVLAMEKLIAEQRADLSARLTSKSAETESLRAVYNDLQVHLLERDVRLNEISTEAQTLRAEIVESDARFHDLAHRANELLNRLQIRDAQIHDLNIQTRDLNNQLLDRDAQIYELTSENRTFQSKIAEFAAQIDELTVNRSDLRRGLDERDLRIEEMAADNRALQRHVAESDSRVSELTSDNRTLHSQITEHAAQIDELTGNFTDLRRELDERDLRIEDIAAENKTLWRHVVERDARIYELASVNRTLHGQLTERSAEIDELTVNRTDLRRGLDQRDLRIEEMAADNRTLQRHVAESDARIYELTSDNRTLHGQMTERGAQIHELTVDRSDLRNGLEERDLRIAELAADNSVLRRHTADRDAQVRELTLQIGDLRDRVEERKARIDEQASKNAELVALVATRDRTLESREQRLAASEERLRRLSQSHVYRLMRRIRLWGWLDPETKSGIEDLAPASSRTGRTLRKVVVDLTPVLPGGGNGGAKVMTLELIRHMGRLALDSEFILLTSEESHDELATLDGPNIRRLCVNRAAHDIATSGSLALRARSVLGRFLPANLLDRIAVVYRQASELLPQGSDLVRKLEADLLFCPFTAPFYFDSTVPTVSVVYDLQHRYYPQFFEAAEIQERDRNLSKAIRVATAIICISDYVRQTLLEHTKARPDRVETIHILLPRRLGDPSRSQSESVLRRFELVSERYLLYPANFWPHKNHELLLTAFKIFLVDNPGSDVKLVLTGSPGPRRDFLQDAVARMGLSQAVLLPGYLSEEELSAVLHSAMALIFPSLFEGFGMPLLEGMAAGRPLLCSNTTSLPEVAGDAALMFDPRIPAEIASAISRLSKDSALWQELAAKSAQRLAAFGGPEEMAARYLKVFRKAVADPSALPAGVFGAFADGWLGEQCTIAFGNGSEARPLRLSLALPDWVPTPSLSICLKANGNMPETHTLNSGESKVIQCFVGSAAGSIEVLCSPFFIPRVCGLGEDTRRLTCQLHTVEIVGADGAIQALASHDEF